jgi:hypothetical protein
MEAGEMAGSRHSGFPVSKQYDIVVRGEVDEYLASAFDEMTVYSENGQTHILGAVVDQSQLHGLLGLIQNLGIELISVNPLYEGAEPSSRCAGPAQ